MCARKDKRYFRREEMETLAAYFGLSLKTGKIESGKPAIVRVRTKYQYTFNELRYQVLMMEGNISPPVLQRKNNPYSQAKKYLGLKKYLKENPRYSLRLSGL